jgi:hypothetical protein
LSKRVELNEIRKQIEEEKEKLKHIPMISKQLPLAEIIEADERKPSHKKIHEVTSNVGSIESSIFFSEARSSAPESTSQPYGNIDFEIRNSVPMSEDEGEERRRTFYS